MHTAQHTATLRAVPAPLNSKYRRKEWTSPCSLCLPPHRNPPYRELSCPASLPHPERAIRTWSPFHSTPSVLLGRIWMQGEPMGGQKKFGLPNGCVHSMLLGCSKIVLLNIFLMALPHENFVLKIPYHIFVPCILPFYQKGNMPMHPCPVLLDILVWLL